jgi:hypothetical protein
MRKCYLPAFALLGGVAAYRLGHVAIRLRGAGTVNVQRLALALILFALLPVATAISGLASLAIVVALLAAMIVYETRIYGPGRVRVRHDYAIEGPMAEWPIDRTGESSG